MRTVPRARHLALRTAEYADHGEKALGELPGLPCTSAKRRRIPIRRAVTASAHRAPEAASLRRPVNNEGQPRVPAAEERRLDSASCEVRTLPEVLEKYREPTRVNALELLVRLIVGLVHQVVVDMPNNLPRPALRQNGSANAV